MNFSHLSPFPFSSMGLFALRMSFLFPFHPPTEFPLCLLPVIPEKVVWSRPSLTRFPAPSILSVGYKAYRQQWLFCPFFFSLFQPSWDNQTTNLSVPPSLKVIPWRRTTLSASIVSICQMTIGISRKSLSCSTVVNEANHWATTGPEIGIKKIK